ncbi:MAG TPA: hypothetical protein PKD26_09100 [Pyrinomonadaceae bacterium]|nr:hypothetical protein [Pyrinomonadaceae bacterium]
MKEKKKAPWKRQAKTQDQREFEEIMEIAERVMRENRELLRRLAKS